MTRPHTLLRVEDLEPRALLTAVSFVVHEVTTVRSDPSTLPDGPDVAGVADLDGNSTPDMFGLVQTTGERNYYWYPNEGGVEQFGPRRGLSATDHWYPFLFPSDIDTDGDVDFIEPLSNHWKIVLHENSGTGEFESRILCELDGDSPCDLEPLLDVDLPGLGQSLAAGDVDLDGDVDLVGYGYWIQNTDEGFKVISYGFDQESANTAFDIQLTDIDGDVAVDVVFSKYDSATEGIRTYWIEFTETETFTAPKPLVEVGRFGYVKKFDDMDGDGDLDLVTSHRTDAPCPCSNLLTVFSNNGFGKFVAAHQLNVPGNLGLDRDFFALADIDADGDLDVAGSTVGGTWWYEFDHASMDYVLHPIAPGINYHNENSIYADDLDGDGDIDLLVNLREHLVSNGSVVWCENRLTGDANDNGEVNFEDFLSVSTNFGKAADAVWEDGDFNADGAVNFADFLLLSSSFGNART